MQAVNRVKKLLNFKAMKIQWGSFAKQKGWEGLNNAAINAFNSDVINSFVREIFQNSIDARQEENGEKKKLIIEINYKTINSDQFPCYEELLTIIEKISTEKANIGHEQFFKQAIDSFRNRNSIRLFEYKDYNTTGLSGYDEDPNSTFNACVLSEGISVKGDDTAGGSYGIGKNSIYGFSRIRTVLYSSFDGKENIFQGVSKLASYTIDGTTYESRIYLGADNKLNSIRNLDALPADVQNTITRNKSGLTQIAVCPIEQEGWVDDFTKSILRNYWHLLCEKQLEVTLMENNNVMQKISMDELEDLMLKYYDPKSYTPDDAFPQGNPYDFYTCYKTCNPIEDDVHMLGPIKFFYKELTDKNTNSIAYIRNGMVVHSESMRGFSSIGYCGIIFCDSDSGNILLRMMEPPTHDKFDPSRLDEKSEKFNGKDGKKALDQIKRIIRLHLNEILNKYRQKAEEIPWLNDLMKSLIGNTGRGKGNRTGEATNDETINRISDMREKRLSFSSVRKNQQITNVEGEIIKTGSKPGENEGGKINVALPPVPPPGPEPPIPPPPPPQPNIQDEGEDYTTKGNKKRRKKAIFNSRIFRKNENKDQSVVYKLILSSKEATHGRDLEINQVGDSGNAASFELLVVTNEINEKLSFEKINNKDGSLKSYKIKNVQIPSVLLLTLKEPYKSTFKILLSSVDAVLVVYGGVAYPGALPALRVLAQGRVEIKAVPFFIGQQGEGGP